MFSLIGLLVHAGSCLGFADCRANRPGLTQAAMSKKKNIQWCISTTRSVSNFSREVLLESVQSSAYRETDLSLLAATVKEVKKGFIKGPINKEELRAGPTLTKRFPVKQKNKVRPIDDYEASLVNFAFTQNEGVTIHSIDHITSMLAFWMRSGSLSVGDGLVAKCWGLSDAYKQVPLSDEAFHLNSYLAVYDPSCSSAKIFKQCLAFRVDSFRHCLPSSFSCTVEGGVHPPSSHAVSLLRRLSLFSTKQRVEACWLLCRRSFLVIGWKISKNKLLDFNTLCKVLGVQLDLRQSGDRLCFVTNTEERVEELVNELYRWSSSHQDTFQKWRRET